MESLKCSVLYDASLWNQFVNEVDETGKIKLDDSSYIQILPKDEFHFMPNQEYIIDIVCNYSSQIALSLFTAWLYDKLKNCSESKKVIIKGEPNEINNQKDLEDLLNKKNGRKK